MNAPSVDGEPLIEASGLDVWLGERQILDDVSLTVHAGEIVTLIGPNGAGKTTLVRTLLGLARPTHGRVRRSPRLRVGYVPQRLAFDSILPLSVERFLRLNNRVQRPRLQAALDEVGAGTLIDAPIQVLSGGEFQRVMLARALLREPRLLVLDEPAQSVDVTGQAELYALIEALRERRGCGVLLVSHDLHLVMQTADSVLCLNGHVCCTGRPEVVSRNPEYLRLFGRRESPYLGVYTHEHDHRHTPGGEIQPVGLQREDESLHKEANVR